MPELPVPVRLLEVGNLLRLGRRGPAESNQPPAYLLTIGPGGHAVHRRADRHRRASRSRCRRAARRRRGPGPRPSHAGLPLSLAGRLLRLFRRPVRAPSRRPRLAHRLLRLPAPIPGPRPGVDACKRRLVWPTPSTAFVQTEIGMANPQHILLLPLAPARPLAVRVADL